MTEANNKQSRDDVLDEAIEAIQRVRSAAACDFTSDNCKCQRGQGRTDAMYDAYEAVRKLKNVSAGSRGLTPDLIENNKLLSRLLKDIYKETGCEADNEAALVAIDEMKTELRQLRMLVWLVLRSVP